MTSFITVIVKMVMFIMFANDTDNYDNYMENDYNKDDLKFSLRL